MRETKTFNNRLGFIDRRCPRRLVWNIAVDDVTGLSIQAALSHEKLAEQQCQHMHDIYLIIRYMDATRS